MKVETRTIEHADGRLEVRRIFADENMVDWDAKNPLAFEKSIVWLDDAIELEYVRFALIRNARSRRGELVIDDGKRRIVGYARLTPDAPYDRSIQGYARRVFYVFNDEMEQDAHRNGMVHPVSRCVDPHTVLPTVMGKMPRCNKSMRLTLAHLNSAEVRPPGAPEEAI